MSSTKGDGGGHAPESWAKFARIARHPGPPEKPSGQGPSSVAKGTSVVPAPPQRANQTPLGSSASGPAGARQGAADDDLFRVREDIWKQHQLANQDLVQRTHVQLRKAGITDRDPLWPVMIALCEILSRETQLCFDLADELKRSNEQQAVVAQSILTQAEEGLAAKLTQANDVMIGAVRAVKVAAESTIDHQHSVTTGVERTIQEAAREAMARWSRGRVWRYTCASVALLVGTSAFAGWLAYGIGFNAGGLQTQAIIQTVDKNFSAVMARDGAATAQHWNNLMVWNHLEISRGDCHTQPNGIGFRMVCSYVFWDGPPLPDRPPAQ